MAQKKKQLCSSRSTHLRKLEDLFRFAGRRGSVRASKKILLPFKVILYGYFDMITIYCFVLFSVCQIMGASAVVIFVT